MRRGNLKKDADESGAEQSNEASPQENRFELSRSGVPISSTTARNQGKRKAKKIIMNACYAKPRSWKIIKKRSARVRRDDAIRYANESLLKDLLPVGRQSRTRESPMRRAAGNGKPACRRAWRWCFGVLADVLAKNTAPCPFWPRDNRLIRQNTKR